VNRSSPESSIRVVSSGHVIELFNLVAGVRTSYLGAPARELLEIFAA